MKIVTVVGARPQFIKASAVSRACSATANTGLDVQEVMVHTGQHYDDNMSDAFFRELDIPDPAYHLGIGGLAHGALTGRILEKLEEVLVAEQPDAVLVYGDTDSTLAGALAAVKLHLPVAHVEAGLRSFNRIMPEEVNRVVADHVSSLLFCPTDTAVDNLSKEGIEAGVHLVGDVMYDVALFSRGKAEGGSQVHERSNLAIGEYALVTVHRQENTESPARLAGILAGLQSISSRMRVVLPLHPRTRITIERLGWQERLASVQVIDPVPYLGMVALEANAAAIITDSGGVQKEAFFYDVPCVTLRTETEWVETVDAGRNRLADTEPQAILEAFDWAIALGRQSEGGGEGDGEGGGEYGGDGVIVPGASGGPYGDGHAGEKIVRILHDTLTCDGSDD